MRAYVEPVPWIERPHRPRTVAAIERLVEWVEAQDAPFTLSEARRGSGAGSTSQQALLSLRQAGLVTCVNPGRMPPRYVRADRATPTG